jgi:hypothetical protein
MNKFDPQRRRLLQSAAAVATGTVACGLTWSARAFQLQEISPGSDIGLAYSGRCGGSSEHAALKTSLAERLAKEPTMRSLSATCPLCGCPVVASR